MIRSCQTKCKELMLRTGFVPCLECFLHRKRILMSCVQMMLLVLCILATCTCYVIPCIRKMVTTMIVKTVDAHYVSLQMQSIQMWWEIWWHFKWLTYDDMEWCSVMMYVLKIHVMKLRVVILKLSIEIDNWRIKKDDFDFDCDFELSIETDKRRDWWR